MPLHHKLALPWHQDQAHLTKSQGCWGDHRSCLGKRPHVLLEGSPFGNGGAIGATDLSQDLSEVVIAHLMRVIMRIYCAADAIQFTS